MGEVKTTSWRDLLKAGCVNQQRRQQLAGEVGVTERTLLRWIRGEGNPQKAETIRLLASTVPEMLEALREAFPEAFSLSGLATHEQIKIPFEFLWPVLEAFAHVPRSAQAWTIFLLLSGQLLPQLDSERAGLLMSYIVQESQDVKFEESAGTGRWTTRQVSTKRCTDRWLADLLQDGRPFFVQSCLQTKLSLPSCIVGHEFIQSLGFFPVYYGGVMIGGILLCSAQEDFFTPQRQLLVGMYSRLMSLAFVSLVKGGGG